ncbi:MAG: hypothetical protein ABI288_07915, partial [Ginsengibacter sp.]
MYKPAIFLFLFSSLFCVAIAQKKDSVTTKHEENQQPRTEVSHGVVTIDGQRINYTSTAGTLILKNDKKEKTASMFYISYTRDGVNDTNHRPITFCYNGGPGGSSVLVNLGGFGPTRVITADAEPTPPPPYQIKENPYSLLNNTDLVFIDAVGTGYSGLLEKGTGSDFWGCDADVTSFSDFIYQYLNKNNLWNRPKFLLGESYGTPRSAMLANRLQQQGIALNGIILISSILNFNNEFWFQPPGSNDLSYELYLPSYAAIAWHHKKLPHQPASLQNFLQDVREFALGDYAQALNKGDTISQALYAKVVQQLHNYTGLSESYLKEANLRVTPQRFEKELLRNERKTVGRYDARYEGIDFDAAGENPDYDPSSTAMFPAVVSAFHNYLLNNLNYNSEADYVFLSYKVNGAWDWHHTVGGHKYPVPNTLPDLQEVMTQNPYLHVFSGNGYYDLATPFFKTEYELNHLNLAPELQKH